MAQQEEEKLAVASSSKAASRFAYDVLANADEAAKAPGVKRGKDGHVQLAAADDFFSSPLSNKSSAAKCAPAQLPQNTLSNLLAKYCFASLSPFFYSATKRSIAYCLARLLHALHFQQMFPKHASKCAGGVPGSCPCHSSCYEKCPYPIRSAYMQKLAGQRP